LIEAFCKCGIAESRKGAAAWAVRQRPVSLPRRRVRVVGRNRFIAPLGEASCCYTERVWGETDWRNKAIAPYDRGCDVRQTFINPQAIYGSGAKVAVIHCCGIVFSMDLHPAAIWRTAAGGRNYSPIPEPWRREIPDPAEPHMPPEIP
jgi:hypothetical protein